MWAVAPLELVPTGSSAGSSGAGSAGGGGAAAAARSPSCLLNRILVVEVSDAGAVGLVTVPLGPSAARPFDVLADQVIGLREGSPIAVVVVHTTAVASAARAEFAAGGSDQMSVVDGWAVLVRKLAAPRSGSSAGGKLSQALLGQATVYALSRSGSVLEDAVLPGTGVLTRSPWERVGASEVTTRRPAPAARPRGRAAGGRELRGWDRLSPSHENAAVM